MSFANLDRSNPVGILDRSEKLLLPAELMSTLFPTGPADFSEHEQKTGLGTKRLTTKKSAVMP